VDRLKLYDRHRPRLCRRPPQEERQVPDLLQCYPGLRVTSFFSRCQFSWLADDDRDATLPPTEHSLKVNVDEEPIAVFDDPFSCDAEGLTHNVRVMILASDGSQSGPALLLGLRDGIPVPIGGYWYSDMDGEDPWDDEVLRRAAVRCAQGFCGMDLATVPLRKALDVTYASPKAVRTERTVVFLAQTWQQQPPLVKLVAYNQRHNAKPFLRTGLTNSDGDDEEEAPPPGEGAGGEPMKEDESAVSSREQVVVASTADGMTEGSVPLMAVHSSPVDEAALRERFLGIVVRDLRAICKDHGISTAGKKVEMVERMVQFSVVNPTVVLMPPGAEGTASVGGDNADTEAEATEPQTDSALEGEGQGETAPEPPAAGGDDDQMNVEGADAPPPPFEDSPDLRDPSDAKVQLTATEDIDEDEPAAAGGAPVEAAEGDEGDVREDPIAEDQEADADAADEEDEDDDDWMAIEGAGAHRSPVDMVTKPLSELLAAKEPTDDGFELALFAEALNEQIQRASGLLMYEALVAFRQAATRPPKRTMQTESELQPDTKKPKVDDAPQARTEESEDDVKAAVRAAFRASLLGVMETPQTATPAAASSDAEAGATTADHKAEPLPEGKKPEAEDAPQAKAEQSEDDIKAALRASFRASMLAAGAADASSSTIPTTTITEPQTGSVIVENKPEPDPQPEGKDPEAEDAPQAKTAELEDDIKAALRAAFRASMLGAGASDAPPATEPQAEAAAASSGHQPEGQPDADKPAAADAPQAQTGESEDDVKAALRAAFRASLLGETDASPATNPVAGGAEAEASEPAAPMPTSPHLCAFRFLDPHGVGLVRTSDVATVLHTLGLGLTPGQVTRLLQLDPVADRLGACDYVAVCRALP